MAERYRELVIMTRPAVVSQGTPGHAMIAVSTAGQGEEAWGFYPDGVQDEIVKGGWGRYTRSAVVVISEQQYRALRAEIDRWQGQAYIMVIRDCTDFALAVLRAARIPIPPDSAWPDNLGADIQALHGRAGGRCLDQRPAVSPWSLIQVLKP